MKKRKTKAERLLEAAEAPTTYALWKANTTESKPLTLEMLQAAWDSAVKAMREPPRPPRRIVSYEVYKRAEEAIDAGMSAREVEYVLMGASLEQAKRWAKIEKEEGE